MSGQLWAAFAIALVGILVLVGVVRSNRRGRAAAAGSVTSGTDGGSFFGSSGSGSDCGPGDSGGSCDAGGGGGGD